MWAHRLELLTTQWCGTGSSGVQFLAGWSTSQGEPEPDGEHGHLQWIFMGGRLTLAILLAVAEIERENIQIQDAEGAAGRMGRRPVQIPEQGWGTDDRTFRSIGHLPDL